MESCALVSLPKDGFTTFKAAQTHTLDDFEEYFWVQIAEIRVAFQSLLFFLRVGVQNLHKYLFTMSSLTWRVYHNYPYKQFSDRINLGILRK
jgi:hypothetical protein